MALYAKMKGPVDYTVVGSPTITDGVVSNVDGQNYLKINGTYNSGTSPFEVQADITTASVSNTYSRIFNLPGISLWTQGGVGNLKLDISTTNGTSINFSQGYQPSTRYVIKLVYDGSNSYAFYVNDTLISTQTGQPPNFSSTAWYTYYLAYADAVSGTTISMDLNNTYIKVNGQLWFGNGFDRVKIRTAPYVRYNIVGTPTITDGILSGCDDSNYLSLPSTLTIGENEDFDIRIKFKTNSLTSGGVVRLLRLLGGTHDYASGIFWRPAQSAIQFNAGALNGSENTQIGGMITNTYYYVKATRTNGKNIVFGWSTDNVNWTTKSWENSAAGSTTTGYINNSIGRMSRADCTDVLIDLNNTNIKVNGQYWWRGDMQYAETYTLRLGD